MKLVESKAKLTPLDQKGDVIKAELCGAVFATRLKTYFEKHCYIKVEQWIHFVDSQTILGAIQKDSYGYQTFFANRIGEIQKAGPVDSWRWVEGKDNIADPITRGASPEELAEGSVWQEGPGFLKLPESDWPVKTAGDINPSVTEEIGELRRKAFSALVTAKAQPRKWSGPTSVALVRLVKPRRFSSLTRLDKTSSGNLAGWQLPGPSSVKVGGKTMPVCGRKSNSFQRCSSRSSRRCQVPRHNPGSPGGSEGGKDGTLFLRRENPTLG